MTKRSTLYTLTLVVVLGLWAGMVLAQDAEPGAVPQKVLAILYNPILLAVLGLAMARAPKVRTLIANRFIPYLQTAVAWLGTLVAGPAAVAMGGPLSLDPWHSTQQVLAWVGSLTPEAHAAGPGMVVAGLFGLPVKGLLGGLAGALWQTAQAHLLYKLLGHKLLGKDPADSVQ